MNTAPRVEDEADRPLDPSVERVRQRLLRFVVINLALLFTAVIIVVAAVVYRSSTRDVSPPAPFSSGVPAGEAFEADIPVPAGARITSQSLAGQRLTLGLELPGGGQTVLVYDLAERRVVARLNLKPQ